MLDFFAKTDLESSETLSLFQLCIIYYRSVLVTDYCGEYCSECPLFIEILYNTKRIILANFQIYWQYFYTSDNCVIIVCLCMLGVFDRPLLIYWLYHQF